jgi:hypothetical protein
LERVTRALLLCLALVLLAAGVRAEPLRSAWVRPEIVRLSDWERGSLRALKAPPFRLTEGHVALVFVAAGDGFRVQAGRGSGLRVGFASGPLEAPSAITWLPERALVDESGRERIEGRVPSWSAARLLAVRSSRTTELSVLLAARSLDRLAWHELDAALGRWLHGSGPIPEVDIGVRPLIGRLVALRAAFGAQRQRAVAPLLEALWLEESARSRPLASPYLARLTNGRDEELSEVVAGRRQEWRVPGADVLEVSLEARGRTRLLLYEGAAIVDHLEWFAPPEGADGVHPWRRARLAPPPMGERVGLEVLEGSVRVKVRAFARREELRALLGTRATTRRSALSRAAASGDELVRLIARARGERSTAAAELLEDRAARESGPELSALLLAEAGRAHSDARRAARLFERAAAIAIDFAETREYLAARARLVGVTGVSRPSFAPLAATRGHAEDAFVTRTYLDALAPSQDGRRPLLAGRVEAWAAASGPEPSSTRVAAEFWRGLTWTRLEVPKGVEALNEVQPVPLEGVCAAGEGELPRVVELGPGMTPFSAVGESGLRGVLELRALEGPPKPGVDETLRIDGVPITVHGRAGVPSFASVARGPHVITRSVPEGVTPQRLLVSLPVGTRVACSSLRSAEAWGRVTAASETTLGLPDPGRASVLRLELRAPRSGRLVVFVGEELYEVWLRGEAPTRVEFPVSEDATRAVLRTSGPLAFRALLKTHPSLRADVGSTPARPRAVVLGQTTNAERLQRLRFASRAVASAKYPDQRAALRRERGALLVALGRRALAVRDGLDPEQEAVSGGWMAERPDLPAVVPLGVAAQLPPLGAPDDDERFERARRAYAVGQGKECVATLASVQGAQVDRLLLAACSEPLARNDVAAAALEALGRAHERPALLVRAAGLLADRGVEEGDESAVLEARLLASEAQSRGADAAGVLGRLGAAVSWYVPPSYDRSAGFAVVESGVTEPDDRGDGRVARPSGIPSHEAPSKEALPKEALPSEAVERALLDAPENSLVIRSGEAAELDHEAASAQRLQIDLGCDAPLDARCELSVEVEGQAVPCPGSDRRRSCEVTLPPGRSRLAIKLAGDAALAWVRITRGDLVVAPHIATTWAEIDAGTPLEITLAGPTLIAIRARGDGQRATELALAGCGTSPGGWAVPLPAERDVAAVRLIGRDRASVGREVRVELPLRSRAPCVFTARVRGGRALVRVALAHVTALPAPRIRARGKDELGVPKAWVRPGSSSSAQAFGEDADPFPLLVGLRTSYRSGSLSVFEGEDERTPVNVAESGYGEVVALGERELWDARVFGALEMGGRVRGGPASALARASLEAPAPVGGVGGALRGEAVEQSGEVGLRGSLLIATRVRLAPSLALVPDASFTLLRQSTRPRTLLGADPDVFSNYGATHPRYASLGVALRARPAIDTTAALSASARSLPEFDGVDRFGARAEFASVPFGLPAPRFGAALATSVRPSGPLREAPIQRHSAEVRAALGGWFAPGTRVEFFGEATASIDAPEGPLTRPTFVTLFGAELSYSGTRGLRDRSDADLTFRDRLEQGSSRVSRIPRGSDPREERE